MGASIIHGRRLELRRERTSRDAEVQCLTPHDGGFEFWTYSSVASLIRFCESLGIPETSWPTYYGLGQNEIPLQEVERQCRELASAMCDAQVPFSATDENARAIEQVEEIRTWLNRGEVFVIVE